MTSLLATGSIGIDTVTTPHGQADEVLGGSAVYFAFPDGTEEWIVSSRRNLLDFD